MEDQIAERRSAGQMAKAGRSAGRGAGQQGELTPQASTETRQRSSALGATALRAAAKRTARVGLGADPAASERADKKSRANRAGAQAPATAQKQGAVQLKPNEQIKRIARSRWRPQAGRLN